MKRTVYASFRPSTATSRWLPVKWHPFRVTSGHLRWRDVSYHVIASSYLLQPCGKCTLYASFRPSAATSRWVHIMMVYPWRVKWSGSGNMSCSFSPLATLWIGVIESYSGGKLPLNKHNWVHIMIVYPWRVKWCGSGNMSCSFSSLATLWNGVIESYSAGKFPLNRRIWLHVVIVYPWRVKWSGSGNMRCSFPHLLHCKIVWLNHTQLVSCLLIDIFECT